MTDVERSDRLRTGDRVTLAGTVSYERSGFVLVRWDGGGGESLVWGADLTREEVERG